MEVVRDRFLSDGWECVEDLVGGDTDSNPVFVRMRFTLGVYPSLPRQINDRQYAYDFYINTFAAEARYQFGNSPAYGVSWHQSREGFTVPIFLFDQREWCDCSLKPVIHVLWVRLSHSPWAGTVMFQRTNLPALPQGGSWVLDEPARTAWFAGQREFNTMAQDGFPETTRSSFLFESDSKYSDWLEDNKSMVAKVLSNLATSPGMIYYNNLCFLADAPGRGAWDEGRSEISWHFEKAVNDRPSIERREAKWHDWHTDRIMFGPGLEGCKPGAMVCVEEDRCEIVPSIPIYAACGNFSLTRMPYERQRPDTWRTDVDVFNLSQCRRIYYIPFKISLFNRLALKEHISDYRLRTEFIRSEYEASQNQLYQLQCGYLGQEGERDRLEQPKELIQLWPMRLSDPDNIRSALIPAQTKWTPHVMRRPNSKPASKKRGRDLLEKYNCLCDRFDQIEHQRYCDENCNSEGCNKHPELFSGYLSAMGRCIKLTGNQRLVLTRVWHALKEIRRSDAIEYKRQKTSC